MKRNIPFALCLVLSLCSVAFAQQNWSDFRGPTMDGHAPAQADPPLKWSETENIKWKTAIHGEGWSSPVVWGDKLWVTTATEDGKKMSLVGLDANTGKVVRDIVVFENEAPQPMSNDRNTYASPSPVVEEGRVYVHFGHHGTAAVDSKSGEIIWKRRDLPCEHKEGSGASPAIYKDLLIFAHDGTERQRIIALNKNTGETVWKTTRSIDYLQWRFDLRKSFGTPIFVEVDGKTQVISSASKAVFAYDPATGEEIWKIRHDGFNGTPRPVVYKDLIFVSTGHMKAELWAMKLGGKGDVTDTHVAWTELRNVPLASSPIVVDDLLYMVADS
ncbi:MAG: PQQ-like beta-propeller repeat protein, partial [Rhodospirillales bacterium]|nr:PQQ-like beta-propeller repeat protein [Rhodospirillales bacterium]